MKNVKIIVTFGIVGLFSCSMYAAEPQEGFQEQPLNTFNLNPKYYGQKYFTRKAIKLYNTTKSPLDITIYKSYTREYFLKGTLQPNKYLHYSPSAESYRFEVTEFEVTASLYVYDPTVKFSGRLLAPFIEKDRIIKILLPGSYKIHYDQQRQLAISEFHPGYIQPIALSPTSSKTLTNQTGQLLFVRVKTTQGNIISQQNIGINQQLSIAPEPSSFPLRITAILATQSSKIDELDVAPSERTKFLMEQKHTRCVIEKNERGNLDPICYFSPQ